MKKIVLIVFTLTLNLLSFAQIRYVRNEISEIDNAKFLTKMAKLNKAKLKTRSSTVQMFLNYPKVDSILQVNSLSGTIKEKGFYWEIFSKAVDTNNLPSVTPQSGIILKGFVMFFNSWTEVDPSGVFKSYSRSSSTVTIDSIAPYFYEYVNGGSGVDTLYVDIYEDSTRYNVLPSCNFNLVVGGAKRVGGDTLIITSTSDLENYYFKKTISLAKNAGFLFKVTLGGHKDSKFKTTASYSENCNDSAMAQSALIGANYYSFIVNYSGGSPFRISAWNTTNVSSSPLTCKKFYAQNWSVFPFISVLIDTPILSVSSNQTIAKVCKNSQVQLLADAQGFNGTPTYTWSPATGLSATNISNPIATVGAYGTVTYSVTVTDGTNTRTGNIGVVSRQHTISITANKTNLTGCTDTATLTANITNGTASIYTWKLGTNTIGSANTVKVNSPGTVSLTLEATSGCIADTSIVITAAFATPPTLDFSYSPTTICQNKDVVFTVKTSAVRDNWTYKWYDGSTEIGSGESYTHQFTTSGTKTVKLTADSGACSATPKTNSSISVKASTSTSCKSSISSTNLSESITIYPNPVRNGVMNIQSEVNQPAVVRVTDIMGKTVASETIQGNKTSAIDMSELHSGIYFVEIESKSDRMTQKVVVDRQ